MDYKFINIEYLETVSGGDPDIIYEIVNIFKEQSVEIFNEMIVLLTENNYPALGLLAHKAKSSVAIMGMDNLAQMLKTFELQAKEGKETQLYKSYIDRFRVETDAAILELEDVINTRKN
jgi:HPt (histidine-containing phosphotransfer) domain-containing protein